MTKSHQRTLLLGAAVLAYTLGAAQVVAEMPDNRTYLPLFKPFPAYPRNAQDSGIEGYVVVEYEIDESGATRNVRAVDQTPESGVFEAAAIAAAKAFHYLPERQDGSEVPVGGIRNRITFELAGDAEPSQPSSAEFAAITQLSTAGKQADSTFQAQLAAAIAIAEASNDGDRFLELARISLNTQPATAEYLVLRARQLGTSDPASLKIVTATTLFNRGALTQARELFTQVAQATSAHTNTAERWIAYLDREGQRRAVVHDTIMQLHR